MKVSVKTREPPIFPALHVLFGAVGRNQSTLEGTNAGGGGMCGRHAELGNEAEAKAGTAAGTLLIRTTLPSLLSNTTQAGEMGFRNVCCRQVQHLAEPRRGSSNLRVVVRPPSEAPEKAALFLLFVYTAQGFSFNENCCRPCTQTEG